MQHSKTTDHSSTTGQVTEQIGNCTHTIGCSKTGKCRVCGYRVWDGTKKTAWIRGLYSCLPGASRLGGW